MKSALNHSILLNRQHVTLISFNLLNILRCYTHSHAHIHIHIQTHRYTHARTHPQFPNAVNDDGDGDDGNGANLNESLYRNVV